MLERIKNWVIVVGSLVVAVLAYLFQRRGVTIRDLQMEKIAQQLEERKKALEDASKREELGYEEAVKNYRRLRDIYDKMDKSSHSERDPPPN